MNIWSRLLNFYQGCSFLLLVTNATRLFIQVGQNLAPVYRSKMAPKQFTPISILGWLAKILPEFCINQREGTESWEVTHKFYWTSTHSGYMSGQVPTIKTPSIRCTGSLPTKGVEQGIFAGRRETRDRGLLVSASRWGVSGLTWRQQFEKS